MASVLLQNISIAAHIQDFDAAESVVPHWGYASRVVPCTNDPGSCEYLDVVYASHDVGMLYSGILWLTILAIVFGWAVLRRASRPTGTGASIKLPVLDHEKQTLARARPGGFNRAAKSIAAFSRRHLLPDALRPIFGRTTRFQVTVLAALTGYLTIWSFAGITYDTWVTPVSDMPGVYNTRTSLGPWSDRIGVLAYALTPFSVLLSSRESILSLLLGVPYQSFNFLHRWMGYLIFVQSALHTIGWCVVEMRLYQPQPEVALSWISGTYMIYGVVAMFILTVLVILSTPWGIRLTGYETFRKLHYILAMLYIGGCWGHWEQLKCFLIPSIIFWVLDRGIRFFRSFLLHYHHLPSGNMGFRPTPAAITVFPDPENGDIVRMEMDNDQDPWPLGQHYYLCFTECSIWQSHPFTPLNAPIVRDGRVRHSYLLRAKSGETKKLAELAKSKLESRDQQGTISTPVILTGPYGEDLMQDITPSTNIVCIAGGTGITYVLPVLQELARQPIPAQRRIELIWTVRHSQDFAWVQPEIDQLQKAHSALNLKIRLFATRDSADSASLGKKDDVETEVKAVNEAGGSSSSSSGEDGPVCGCDDEINVRKTGDADTDEGRHPNLDKLVRKFVEATTSGPTVVFASGPGGMISDLRSIVASCNSGSKVWAGEERGDVRLVCDDRLEW